MNKLIIALIAVLSATNVHAQIPQQVTDILEKCDKVMDNPKGLEIDMKVHVGMVLITMDGTMKWYSKGDLSREIMKVKALGVEMVTETGYDGENNWEFKPASIRKKKKGTEKDSLIITKGEAEKSVDLGIDKEYKKATMKEKDNLYIITFSEPKNPKEDKVPKKTVIKINKSNYYLHEFEGKVGPATMRMTATKYKVGVDDNIFKLDPAKFPDAVVVRR